MPEEAILRLTRRYRFSAAHRLHAPSLSEEANRELYGKCNNPFGHGHDYVIDITVEGRRDGSGQLVRREALDGLVRERVLAHLDHKNLNRDLPQFRAAVPTTENLATVIQSLLQEAWTLPARLARIQISETGRNTFAWESPVPERESQRMEPAETVTAH